MADQRLTWALCDKQGARIGSLNDRLSGRVLLGVNDIRNGTVELSLEDPAVAIIQAQETRLKAFLGEEIILNAPVFLPHYEGEAGSEGTVEVSATDNVQLAAALTAEFAAQVAVDQGEVMWRLVQNANAPVIRQPSGSPPGPVIALAGSPPGHGIIAGALPATSNLSRQYYDGQKIWDLITELTQLDGGIDFELEPLDRDDGVFKQLNTIDLRQGSDKTDSVIFEVGTARQNATGWSWEPSREQLVNFFLLAGATDSLTGQAEAVLAQHGDSQDQFGLYQGWEIDPNFFAGGADAEARAKQIVAARAYPIDFFTITPAVEQGGTAAGWARDPSGELVETGQGYGVPPRFAPDGDYWLGDTIKAIVKEGELTGSFPGRVTTAAISEVDQAGNVAVELGCTPAERASAGVTTNFAYVTLGPADQFSSSESIDTSEPQDTVVTFIGFPAPRVKKPPRNAPKHPKAGKGQKFYWVKSPGDRKGHWEQHETGWTPPPGHP